MKPLKNTTLYSRLALITSVTLVVGYFVVYAAYQTFTSPEYQSGAALSSTFLGKIVSNLDEINGRVTTLEGSIAGASVWSKVGSDINYTAGKVGIGTTTPAASLDVKRTAADSQFAGWIEGSDVNNYGLGVNIANTTSAKAIADFKSGNTSRLFVRADGNVGIGTSSPGAKLEVNGNIKLNPTNELRYYNVAQNNWTSLDSPLLAGDNLPDFRIRTTTGIFYMNGGGNVGIGTTSPSQKLSIGEYNTNNNVWISRASNVADSVGTIRSYIAIGINDTNETYVGTGDSHMWKIGSMVSGWVNPIYGYNTHYNDDLSFSYKQRGYAEVTAMIIQGGTGNVGIGTTTPGTDKLYVNGTARGTSWTNISDLRFKKNITPITSALDAIEKLQGVTFDWRIGEFTNRNFPKGKQIGFIAQDVEKILPEVVTTDSDGYKGVEYANITAVLVEAVKELKKENTALKQENQDIKSLVCSDHPTAGICQ